LRRAVSGASTWVGLGFYLNLSITGSSFPIFFFSFEITVYSGGGAYTKEVYGGAAGRFNVYKTVSIRATGGHAFASVNASADGLLTIFDHSTTARPAIVSSYV
jgi:hypothetical protein